MTWLCSFRVCAAICMTAVGLSGAGRGGDAPLNDWNRVTSLQPKRLVIVKRFKTSGKKVKGLLLRADVRSVRVETKDGDIEIPRDTVQGSRDRHLNSRRTHGSESQSATHRLSRSTKSPPPRSEGFLLGCRLPLAEAKALHARLTRLQIS